MESEIHRKTDTLVFRFMNVWIHGDTERGKQEKIQKWADLEMEL
jgi:hypothetical protein